MLGLVRPCSVMLAMLDHVEQSLFSLGEVMPG